MSASPISSTLTGNPILDAVDGGERWSGTIIYNRVSPNTAAEQQFASTLPSAYGTDHVGLSAAAWAGVKSALSVLSHYAKFTYADSDALDANYLVSDFYKSDSPNNAGIAAQPGNGAILALNMRSWNSYSPEQLSYIALHEVSHTLGLQHPDGLPPQLNYSQYTLMSYDWYTLGDEDYGIGVPLTPMALDVAVLQAKYGAAAFNTGDNSYNLNAAGQIGSSVEGYAGGQYNGVDYICVWDTGGRDSLVVSTAASSISQTAPGALLNLNAATLSTSAYTGALAEVIGDVARTSKIFGGLSASAQAEITDPARSAGGFFSSRILIDGERYHAGYTIAHGAVIEDARGAFGADLMIGNEAANRLDGWLGNDELYGGAGGDLLLPGEGDDRAFGGSGDDTVSDEAGSNFLRGGEGNDSISSQSTSFDDIQGNEGQDNIVGGPGGDWLVGGKGDDQITSQGGNDILLGNLGGDTLSGGAGSEIIRGGQGNDVLKGDDGADWLSGDRGDDTVTGGAGADIFHGSQDAGIDRITDFNYAEGDRVVFDAGTTYSVSQSGGDVVLAMSPGHQMVLVGVQLSTLPQGWIL